MSESQLDRVSAWRKAHRRRLAIVGLSGIEQHLVLVIDMLAIRDLGHLVHGEARPDVGWAVRDDGRPLTRRELAAHLRLAPGQEGARELGEAIAGLVELGHLVVADDGAIGSVGWCDLQETPDAQRKREARAGRREDSPPPAAASRAPAGVEPADVSGTPPGQSAECPTQMSEDRRQNQSSSDNAGAGLPEPATLGARVRFARESMGLGLARISDRTGISPATLRAIEHDEVDATTDELDLLARHIGDPSIARASALPVAAGDVALVAGELHDVRAGLGAVEPRPAVTGDVARDVWAPAKAGLIPEGMGLVEAWRTVMRRAGEEAKRNAEDGRGGRRDLEFMTLRSLGGATRWRRYLGNSDLDRRREPRQARASPNGAHVVVTKGRKYTDGNPLAKK